MDTVKVKLKLDQGHELLNYLELCADSVIITEDLPDQLQLAYYILKDLRNQVRKKLHNDQQQYTIKFKPYQVIVFLMLHINPTDPYSQTVIRKVREDLHQALINRKFC